MIYYKPMLYTYVVSQIALFFQHKTKAIIVHKIICFPVRYGMASVD